MHMATDEAQARALANLSLDLLSPASLYDDWLVAETKASLALAAWPEARPAARARPSAAYAAALAHEASAADLLAARLRHACLPPPRRRPRPSPSRARAAPRGERSC